MGVPRNSVNLGGSKAREEYCRKDPSRKRHESSHKYVGACVNIKELDYFVCFNMMYPYMYGFQENDQIKNNDKAMDNGF